MFSGAFFNINHFSAYFRLKGFIYIGQLQNKFYFGF